MVQQASHQQYVNHVSDNKTQSTIVHQVVSFFCGRAVSITGEGSGAASASMPRALTPPQAPGPAAGVDKVFGEREVRQFKSSADFDQVSWT